MPDGKDSEEKKDEAQANRWWEQYYVRYFVGTFVGVVVIFVLREKATLACDFKTIIPAFSELDGAKFAALASVGLAYCYIASAPILTLHAVRGNWSERAVDTVLAAPPPSPAAPSPVQPTQSPATASLTSPSVQANQTTPSKWLGLKKPLWRVIGFFYLTTALAISFLLWFGPDDFSDLWAKKVGLILGTMIPVLQLALICQRQFKSDPFFVRSTM